MTWLVMWRRPQARSREHVSASEVAIDSTLLSLTQALSYVLLGSQAALLAQRVFRKFFSHLSPAIEGCLDTFAGELLSNCNWEAAKDVSELAGLTSTKNRINCCLLFKVRLPVRKVRSH